MSENLKAVLMIVGLVLSVFGIATFFTFLTGWTVTVFLIYLVSFSLCALMGVVFGGLAGR